MADPEGLTSDERVPLYLGQGCSGYLRGFQILLFGLDVLGVGLSLVVLFVAGAGVAGRGKDLASEFFEPAFS